MFLLKRFASNSNKNLKFPPEFGRKLAQLCYCLIKLPRAKYSVCRSLNKDQIFQSTHSLSSNSSSNNSQYTKVGFNLEIARGVPDFKEPKMSCISQFSFVNNFFNFRNDRRSFRWWVFIRPRWWFHAGRHRSPEKTQAKYTKNRTS